jgi:parallel beta-helix repeat protein
MGTWQRLCSAIVFCIAAVLSGVTGSSTTVLQVCGSGCAFTSIQAAIDAAASGDTVRVADGVYVELVDFKGKAVTVRSVNGPARTTIDGNALGSVVTFATGEGGGSVLDGFTVTNGRSANGAGIRCAGASPAIRHCTISSNYATATGGGISCDSSSPVIENCTVRGNHAAEYGGGINCTASAPAITNCTVSGNFAGIEGGGVS